DFFKELDQKCVIIKELATILSLRADKVRKFLGDLQAIYDREYRKLTGSVGLVEGKAAFAIVACVTPSTLDAHQEYMSRIGPGFLTYRLPQLTEAEEAEGLAMLWDDERANARQEALGKLRALVAEHLQETGTSSRTLKAETPAHRATI